MDIAIGGASRELIMFPGSLSNEAKSCTAPCLRFLGHIYLFLFIYLTVFGLSCVTWDLSLQHTDCGSGFSFSAACGILVPRPGIKPKSSKLQGGFLTTGPQGKSCLLLLISH